MGEKVLGGGAVCKKNVCLYVALFHLYSAFILR